MEQIALQQAQSRRDASRIAALAQTVWTEHYTPIIGAGQVRYMLDHFQSPEQIYRDMTENAYTYLLAEADGRPAGYCSFRDDGERDSVFLSKLYVLAAMRRHGLAGRMLGAARAYAAGRGRSRIWLTVNKQNLHSIEAYQKMGFAIERPLVTDIGDGYRMDDYVMALRIRK
jgi:GNAT superfamily N-acetyltransferase